MVPGVPAGDEPGVQPIDHETNKVLPQGACRSYIGVVELIDGPIVFFSVLNSGIFLHCGIMF